MLFGTDLIKCSPYQDIELLIPVPLHPKREFKRGYNQSAEIGKGMSESMGKPLISGNLIRNHYSTSQTSKGRFERWENVKELFSVKDPVMLEGKHLLLIDDVVTTGSTLEACAQVLLKISGDNGEYCHPCVCIKYYTELRIDNSFKRNRHYYFSDKKYLSCIFSFKV